MYDPDINDHNYRPIIDSAMQQQCDMPQVTIYSDGSYKPAINYGGYGTLMECGMHRALLYGGSQSDSNNRMEITGVLAGLRCLNRPCVVTVISDSRYVVDAINGYIWNWVSNNWTTSQNKPVANRDLWEEMFQYIQIHRIHGVWIKGHTGHPENERCDRLATMGAYHSANLPVPASKQLAYDLSKGKFPGSEDDDTIESYDLP